MLKELSPVMNEGVGRLLDRHIYESATLEVAAETLLRHIEQDHEDLAPGIIKLTSTQERLLKLGGIVYGNVHELVVLLKQRRNVRQVAELFSFEKLEEAKVALAEATKSLMTTRATFEEITVDDSDEPAIVKQVTAMQAKLNSLRLAEDQARSRVASLEENLATLKRSAPKSLKSQCEHLRQDLENSEEGLALKAVVDEIEKLQVHLHNYKEVSPPGNRRFRKTWVAYCEYTIPDLFSVRTHKDGLTDFKPEVLEAHMKENEVRLATLLEEREQLQVAYDLKSQEIDPDGPFIRWIESGCQLSLEVLCP